MSYDRADWHYGGDYPEDLPPENGATHIGMFLAWAINAGLAGDLHTSGSQEALQAVRERRVTGAQFLIEQCDEKFTEEDLNDEGNLFTKEYYGSNQYIDDYIKTLAQKLSTVYYVADTWENYDKIAAVIDERYKRWKLKARQ